MSPATETREILSSWGDHPVFVEYADRESPREWYAEAVLRRIDEARRFLVQAGVVPRMPIAILLANSVDFVSFFLAAVELRALPSPIKLDYRSVELEAIFSDLEPSLAIVEDSHLPVIARFVAECGLVTREQDQWTLVRSARAERIADEVEEGIASINFTYRGLGYPLGALIPGEQYFVGAEIFAEGIRGGICRRVAVILPMAHIFALIGCLFAALLERMTIHLIGTLMPRPLLSTIQRHRIDFLVVVPEVAAFLNRFADRAGDLSCLDTVGSGGSLLPPELYEQTRLAFDAEVLHGYGLTEFTPVSRNFRGLARPGTIGPVADAVEVRIENPDPSGLGEIQIRSPLVAPAYYRRPTESAAARTADGWFRTGDLGRFDEGHLVFVRELKETCKVNGLMVDLAEVRRVVAGRFGCGEPEVSLRDGKLVLSCRFGDDHLPDIARIRRDLSRELAPYKLPQVVENARR